MMIYDDVHMTIDDLCVFWLNLQRLVVSSRCFLTTNGQRQVPPHQCPSSPWRWLPRKSAPGGGPKIGHMDHGMSMAFHGPWLLD